MSVETSHASTVPAGTFGPVAQIDVGVLDVGYVDVGPRDGPAVLLLHGAFDYAAAFDEIGPKLAYKGFTALAIDQRGFGATESRGLWAGAARMSCARFLPSIRRTKRSKGCCSPDRKGASSF